MSISAAISNAYSRLASVSRMAETVSNNVANAMNEDYARREVITGQRVVGGGHGRVGGLDQARA